MAANKTIRWLAILDLLESEERWWSTSDIHESIQGRLSRQGIQQSLRTTQRDMAEIRDSGLVELGDSIGSENGGRWRLLDSAISVDRKRFSSPDLALILLLASRHLTPLLPLEVQQRLNILAQRCEAHFKSRSLPAHWVRPWQNKVRILQRGHALLPPKIDPQVITEIYRALDRHKKLRLSYFKPGREPRSGVYQPLGLVYKPPLFYLVVLREDSVNPHNLAIHRIIQAEVLSEDSVASPSFDLDQYLADNGTEKVHEKAVKLVLSASRRLCDHWDAAHIGNGQTIEYIEDGGIVTAIVDDTDSLRQYLLGKGTQIRVIAPDSIVSWISSEVSGMTAERRLPTNN
ncbi:MAG TPA: WYL domain-containing protein [Arenimonas sp.]|nr:WYL domain-containing protein [Arenimonas sp.]